MLRSATILLVAAALAGATAPAFAQTAEAPHHARKATKSRKAAPAAAPASGGINQPSTDFSTVERADDDATAGRGPGSNMRPVMGPSGNIGLGTGF